MAGELHTICPICTSFLFKPELTTGWIYNDRTQIVSDASYSRTGNVNQFTTEVISVCCKWGVPSFSPLLLQLVPNRVRNLNKSVLMQVQTLVHALQQTTTSKLCRVQASGGIFYLTCTLDNEATLCLTATRDAVQIVGEPVPYLVPDLWVKLVRSSRVDTNKAPTLTWFWQIVINTLIDQKIGY